MPAAPRPPGGGLLHLLPVLVHADQQMDIIAAETAIAGNHIGADLFERMAKVRITVGVIDGSRQVEARHPGKLIGLAVFVLIGLLRIIRRLTGFGTPPLFGGAEAATTTASAAALAPRRIERGVGGCVRRRVVG